MLSAGRNNWRRYSVAISGSMFESPWSAGCQRRNAWSKCRATCQNRRWFSFGGRDFIDVGLGIEYACEEPLEIQPLQSKRRCLEFDGFQPKYLLVGCEPIQPEYRCSDGKFVQPEHQCHADSSSSSFSSDEFQAPTNWQCFPCRGGEIPQS